MLFVALESKLFLYVVLAIFAMFATKVVAQKLYKGITVTPSYTLGYDVNGDVAYARCKATGKFVSKQLAIIELNSYLI